MATEDKDKTNAECPPPETAKVEKKLSAPDFMAYNRMAEHMDYFHNHFRSMWKTMYSACEAGKRPLGMSISQFLGLAERFCSSLDMHHNIEEVHIFPVR